MRQERKNALVDIIIEASVKLVLIVPSSTMKKTVKNTWLELTVKTEHVQKDIARSANSGIADTDALGKVCVKDQVQTHKVKNRQFQLCLQCDDTIKNKEVLLKKTFCLKKIPKHQDSYISEKELDCLVKN